MNQDRAYNFGAGPAMLPTEVMLQVQEEFLNFNGLGSSIIEISHRSSEFIKILEETESLFRKIAKVPENYDILFMHGGARMQFSAIPMNLLSISEQKKAAYIISGSFSKMAYQEAKRYGDIDILANSEPDHFDRIPEVSDELFSRDYAYVHLTSNNTIFGTQWKAFPKTEATLVADFTSEILSRNIDVSQFGVIYAGLQKNLGPSGVAVVIIRKDLVGKALEETPNLLNYESFSNSQSMPNTINTFAVYVLGLILKWIEKKGGLQNIEELNEKKAALLYKTLDNSNFYRAVAHPNHRSLMNVTFRLASDDLQQTFLEEAEKHHLTALKGHRSVGGIRASIYNAMPLDGVQALVNFMKEFEQRHG